jgi:hypothetical protein
MTTQAFGCQQLRHGSGSRQAGSAERDHERRQASLRLYRTVRAIRSIAAHLASYNNDLEVQDVPPESGLISETGQVRWLPEPSGELVK